MLVQPSKFGGGFGGSSSTGFGGGFSSGGAFSSNTGSGFASANTGGFSFKSTLQGMNTGSGIASNSPSVFGGSPGGLVTSTPTINPFGVTNTSSTPTFGGSAFSFKSSVNQLQQQQTMQVQQPSFGQNSSVFGQPSAATSTVTAPAFGSSASFSSPFTSGFGQPAFGSSATSTVFGQTSGFGTSGIFGGSPSTFASVAAAAPTTAAFGAPAFSFKNAQQQMQTQQPSQPTSVFGNTVSQATTASPFSFGNAMSASNAPTSVFSQSNGSFGSNAVVKPSSFGQITSESSPTATQPSAASLFSTPTSSLFGNAASSSSMFGGQPIVQDNPKDCYSDLNELSAEDVAAFQSEFFEFGKIPLLPPAIELCT